MCAVLSRSVMSDSLWPYVVHQALMSMGILQNTGVGFHALLQGSSQPRDQIQISHIAGGLFTIWATREARSGIIDLKLEHLNLHSNIFWL